MPEPRKLRVFLCHASQDKPVVRELYQRLLAEGWIDPWLDEEKLLPGQDWDMTIKKAVKISDAVIVFLSNSSITKEGYIQKEIRFVLDIADEKPDGNTFIIPVKLEDCDAPERLKNLQYLLYFPSNGRIKARARLYQALTSRANQLGIIGEPQSPRYETIQFQVDDKTIDDYVKVKDEDATYILISFREYRIDGFLKHESISKVSFSTTIKELLDRHQSWLPGGAESYELIVRTPVKSIMLGNLIDNNSVFMYKPLSNE